MHGANNNARVISIGVVSETKFIFRVVCPRCFRFDPIFYATKGKGFCATKQYRVLDDEVRRVITATKFFFDVPTIMSGFGVVWSTEHSKIIATKDGRSFCLMFTSAFRRIHGVVQATATRMNVPG